MTGAKEDDDLVEVIYACMDGYVYFLDLKTGKPTRDTLNLGFTFKGAGALDPRGYPILYVGQAMTATLAQPEYLWSTSLTAAPCTPLEIMTLFLFVEISAILILLPW
ncbi:MAG: hypothetical protein V8Q57_09485 [Blautia sp.]